MATKSSNTAKIVVIVLGVLAGLGLLCCGAGWFFGVNPLLDQFVKPMITLQQSLPSTALGAGAQFAPYQRGPNDVVLLFGVSADVELTPERVTELQDSAWTAYVAAFSQGGFPFANSLGIGHAQPGTNPPVTDWQDHVVTLAEIAARTGVAAPPPGMMDKLGAGGTKIEVKVHPDEGSGDETIEDER